MDAKEFDEKVASRNVAASMNFFFLAGMVKGAMLSVDNAEKRERGLVALDHLEGIAAEVDKMLSDIEGRDKELKLPPFMGGVENKK